MLFRSSAHRDIPYPPNQHFEWEWLCWQLPYTQSLLTERFDGKRVMSGPIKGAVRVPSARSPTTQSSGHEIGDVSDDRRHCATGVCRTVRRRVCGTRQRLWGAARPVVEAVPARRLAKPTTNPSPTSDREGPHAPPSLGSRRPMLINRPCRVLKLHATYERHEA